MEAIKRVVRTPKNHEIQIKIPEHVPENDPIEIVMFFRKKNEEHNNKINALKHAMEDKLFMSDLREISGDFENIDTDGWQE